MEECRNSNNPFESSVNPEGIQTVGFRFLEWVWFESSVNPEGIQTMQITDKNSEQFESSVNPEGIQTGLPGKHLLACLRAV